MLEFLRRHLADTRPLRRPDFRRLWIAQAITMIGAQLTVVTVPAQLWEITRDSGMVGLTGLFGLVPLLVFGLWGGAIADAHDRRRVLLISTAGLIATSGLFFVQALAGWRNPWVILAIFAIQQAFFGLSSPARNAILPALVADDELPAANALNMMLFTFGGIAGPLLGGALLPVLGFSWLYLIDTLALLATLWAVLRLPAMRPAGALERAGLGAVVEGLTYLRGRTVLVMSLVVDVIAMVAGMPRVLFPQMADDSFGGPATGGMELAVLFIAIPAGGLVGGVFSGWISRVRRQGRATLAMIALWGVAMIVAGLATNAADGRWAPWLIVVAAALAVGGAADMASAAFRQSILLQATSDEVRGRLQGLFFVVVVGGPRLADTLHGWLGASVGPGWATAVGGAVVVAGMAACALLAPSLWRYEPAREPTSLTR